MGATRGYNIYCSYIVNVKVFDLVVKALRVTCSRSGTVNNIPFVMLLQVLSIGISGLCIGQYKYGTGVLVCP